MRQRYRGREGKEERERERGGEGEEGREGRERYLKIQEEGNSKIVYVYM